MRLFLHDLVTFMMMSVAKDKFERRIILLGRTKERGRLWQRIKDEQAKR